MLFPSPGYGAAQPDREINITIFEIELRPGAKLPRPVDLNAPKLARPPRHALGRAIIDVHLKNIALGSILHHNVFWIVVEPVQDDGGSEAISEIISGRSGFLFR